MRTRENSHAVTRKSSYPGDRRTPRNQEAEKRRAEVQRAEQLAADEERRRVEVEVEAAAEPPPEFFRLRVKNVGADDLAVSHAFKITSGNH